MHRKDVAYVIVILTKSFNPRLAEEIVVSSWFKPFWAGKS